MFAGSTIVFDLDGTLIDTAPDLTGALNHVLTSEGRDAVPEADVRHMVGQGALMLIRRGMAATGAPVSEADLPRLLAVFLEYYGQNIAVRSALFPQVREVLDFLREQKAILAVCTNKPRALSVPLFEALALADYFPVIVGGDCLPIRKPDPAHLLTTIARAGGSPERAVMIGDSFADIDAAKAASIPSVAVSFGYSSKPVTELGADRIIDNFAHLPQTVGELLSMRPSTAIQS